MPTPCTAPASGSKTITTAATPLQITATSTPIHNLWIQASPSNTGRVAVGWSNAVRATVGSETAPVLLPGQAMVIKQGQRFQQQFDLSDLWFDVSVSGEKVLYFYF